VCSLSKCTGYCAQTAYCILSEATPEYIGIWTNKQTPNVAECKPIIYQTNPRGGCVASPPTISCETSGLAIRRNDRAYQFVHEANRVTTAIWAQRAWTTKRFYYHSRFLTIWNVKRKDLPKTRLLDIVQPHWLHFIILEIARIIAAARVFIKPDVLSV